MILFNPHLIPLLPSAGKPAVPANRRLERSDRIGGVDSDSEANRKTGWFNTLMQE